MFINQYLPLDLHYRLCSHFLSPSPHFVSSASVLKHQKQWDETPTHLSAHPSSLEQVLPWGPSSAPTPATAQHTQSPTSTDAQGSAVAAHTAQDPARETSSRDAAALPAAQSSS